MNCKRKKKEQKILHPIIQTREGVRATNWMCSLSSRTYLNILMISLKIVKNEKK